MRKPISLILIIAFLSPAVAAQQKGRGKAQGSARETDASRRRAEEAQRRAQAIDILKSVVDGAADIRETQSRVAVLSGALDLLWKHDEPYARASFVKSADTLSDRFASGETQRQERSEIRAAIGELLKALPLHR